MSFLNVTKRPQQSETSFHFDPVDMLTLDLISQVLFVALMAMLLYVLYRRFVAMMMRGRITGSYARVASCIWAEPGRIAVAFETDVATSCRVEWEGGHFETQLEKGPQVVEIHLDQQPEMLKFDFGNQVIRRRIDG